MSDEQGYPAGCPRCEVFFDRLEAGTLHRLVCNADHSKPIGGDMCICNPLKEKLTREQERSKALAEALRLIKNDAGSHTVVKSVFHTSGFGYIYRIASAALESK